MSPDEDAFLAAIRANPADDTNRLVYADWLDDRSRPDEAEYVRLLCEVRRASLRLADLRRRMTKTWARSVSPWWRVVLIDLQPAKKIQVIKLIRELTGYRLGEVVSLIEVSLTNSPPVVLKSGLSLDSALAIARVFDGVAEVAVEADPTDAAQ